ncbi:MAG: aromatic amino acid transport family protein [Patescibacteria group bacterium]
MPPLSRAFRRSTFAMLGTVIGAGTFGLPAAMQAMGIFVGTLVYWAVALVVLCIHLLYAEIVLRDKSTALHRFPGHLEKAFGSKVKTFGYLTYAAQICGSCLAYLILGGDFLAAVATHLGVYLPVLAWQILFWVGGAAVVFVGLKLVQRVEAWMTVLLIVFLLAVVWFYGGRVDPALFQGGNWHQVMPFVGVFLFSLFGWSVIPEVGAILNFDPRRTRLAVAGGSLAAAFLMWLFGTLVYAGIGARLTSNPADLSLGIPAQFFWLIPLVGFLAVATSFITLIQSFKAMLHLDAGLPKFWSWLTALGIPLFLLLVTSRNFLHTVDFVGAIISSINALLIALLAMKLLKGKDGMQFVWRYVVSGVCAVAFGSVLVWKLIG